MNSRHVSMLFLAAAVIFAQAPQQPSGPTSFTVGGDLPTPLTLNADDLAKLPRQKASVPDQDGTEIVYEGVPLREILKKAGAPLGNQLRGKALASYLLIKAQDGYQVVFTLAEVDDQFANERILIADKRDGKPLTGNQGPFRLIIANDHAGARSVRMLESIQFVRLQK